MQKVISFPHMGSYHVPIEVFLKLVFPDCTVRAAPEITRRTLELGSKYSPDFVCVPFKYNLGNFIEALEAGADVLVQAGGGCRFGYYAEIQELILRDLGYQFEFVKLVRKGINPFDIYRIAKKIGTRVSFLRFARYLLLALRMVSQIDDIEAHIRENVGFEVQKGSFESLRQKLFARLKTVTALRELRRVCEEYRQEFQRIPIEKPPDCLKVGVVGELYTLMEPFCNYFLEKELAEHKIQVSRQITLTFLLFEKARMRKKTLAQAGDYLRYTIGADGTESVGTTRRLALEGYDGIIHLKPFGCIPEINAMPMLQNISRDQHIPVLHFSLDSQTSETGVKTRLEAFYDMLVMRRERNV